MNQEATRKPPLTLDLPSIPLSATRARHAACEYAAAVGAELEAVALAVAEAVANAVLHGYRGGSFGLIRMRMQASDEELLISVTDRGHGMAPNPDSEGLGMGLALIGGVCDQVKIEAPHRGGTRLLMSFRLA